MVQSRFISIFRKKIGIIEQIGFSSISFLLLLFYGLSSDITVARDFVIVFSVASAGYVVANVFVTQPYVIESVKSKCSDKYFIPISLFVIFSSSCVSFSIFTVLYWNEKLDIIEFYLYGVIFSSSWSLHDLLRKRYIAVSDNLSAFFITAIIFTSVFLLSVITLSYQGVDEAIKKLVVLYSGSVLILYVVVFFIYVNKNKKGIIDPGLYGYMNNCVEFGYPLLLGSLLFWAYSQGLYLYMAGRVSDDMLVAIRIAQNFASILAIYIVYCENKLMVSMGRSYTISLEYRARSIKDETFFIAGRLMFVSAIIYPFVIVVNYFVYGVDGSSLLYLTLFFISCLLMGVSKPAVVLLRLAHQTKFILLSHVMAFLSCIFVGAIFEYGDFYYLVPLIFVISGPIFSIVSIWCAKNGNFIH